MASDLRIRILDVGQGDTIVGLLPDSSRAFVVDVHRAAGVLRLLESEAIREVVLYLSHSDRDHTRGAVDLLTGFRGTFSRIFINQDRWGPRPDTEYRRLLQTIAELSRASERTLVRSPLAPLTADLNADHSYRSWFGSSVRVVVLHPAPSDLFGLVTQGTNDVSGVLLVEHVLKAGVRRRILLAADVQLTGISLLLHRADQRPVCADVLKYPHHGAWPMEPRGASFVPGVVQRTMAEFLAAVAPRAVIFSVGFANAHGHVKAEAFDALRDYHSKAGRLNQIMCTQFTSTCLRRRLIEPDFSAPSCAGDIEIRTGDSVGDDGIAILSTGDAHLDHIQGILAAGGAPQCSFLPSIRKLTKL